VSHGRAPFAVTLHGPTTLDGTEGHEAHEGHEEDSSFFVILVGFVSFVSARRRRVSSSRTPSKQSQKSN
jgi:hypothetical protein